MMVIQLSAPGYWAAGPEPAPSSGDDAGLPQVAAVGKQSVGEVVVSTVGDGVGLTVNAVTPGYIATDMFAAIPEKVVDRIRGQIPVGRLGRPDEIARVVAFLAADESAYITGQVWSVNGGLDM